uniref:Uncharacterized protein n=1 Tax=Opuntia streptacantha TaxID=393608 RepID=A0A7C8ZA34_OPUST
MPPRRRKKPPDLPCPYLILPLHLPPSRIHSTEHILALHLGFSSPSCSLFSRSAATVATDLGLAVWALGFTVRACTCEVGDCSWAWRFPATPIYAGSCALATVSNVFAPPSAGRHSLFQVLSSSHV